MPKIPSLVYASLLIVFCMTLSQCPSLSLTRIHTDSTHFIKSQAVYPQAQAVPCIVPSHPPSCSHTVAVLLHRTLPPLRPSTHILLPAFNSNYTFVSGYSFSAKLIFVLKVPVTLNQLVHQLTEVSFTVSIVLGLDVSALEYTLLFLC